MNPNDFSNVVVNPPAPATWRDYFTAKYFFETPPQASRLYIPLLIVFGLMIILAVVFKLFGKGETKKISQRYFYPFLTCGILGLVYLFARYEGLPWLSVRFFLVAVLAVFAIWLIYNFVWIIKYLLVHTAAQKKNERYEQYLPRAKKATSNK